MLYIFMQQDIETYTTEKQPTHSEVLNFLSDGGKILQVGIACNGHYAYVSEYCKDTKTWVECRIND